MEHGLLGDTRPKLAACCELASKLDIAQHSHYSPARRLAIRQGAEAARTVGLDLVGIRFSTIWWVQNDEADTRGRVANCPTKGSITDSSRSCTDLKIGVHTSEYSNSPIFSDMKAMPAQAAGKRENWRECEYATPNPCSSTTCSAVNKLLGAHFDNFSTVQYPELLND
jgi:hypothetical protein